MSPEETSGAERKRDDWLRRHVAARRRPWALAEQLLGLTPETGRELLAALEASIGHERAEIARLQDELEERGVQLAVLEEHLRELGEVPESDRTGDRGSGTPPAPRATVELRQGHWQSRLDYWLCRCHGFDVYANAQDVGRVEGLRFASRVDRPDLLEVRSGRLRHRLLLVPTADVEDVDGEEQIVFLKRETSENGDLLHALIERVRARLDQLASPTS